MRLRKSKRCCPNGYAHRGYIAIGEVGRYVREIDFVDSVISELSKRPEKTAREIAREYHLSRYHMYNLLWRFGYTVAEARLG